MTILLHNGHGQDTPGKRSPDGFFREYAYTRFLAKQIQEHLIALGLDARLLVPELEDISLPERCHRVNTLCQELGKDQVLLISLHVNAAGNGREWMNARGWSCYTTPGQTPADRLATALYEAAEDWLPDHRLRKDNTDGDPDIESNFYVLRGGLIIPPFYGRAISSTRIWDNSSIVTLPYLASLFACFSIVLSNTFLT